MPPPMPHAYKPDIPSSSTVPEDIYRLQGPSLFDSGGSSLLDSSSHVRPGLFSSPVTPQISSVPSVLRSDKFKRSGFCGLRNVGPEPSTQVSVKSCLSLTEMQLSDFATTLLNTPASTVDQPYHEPHTVGASRSDSGEGRDERRRRNIRRHGCGTEDMH